MPESPLGPPPADPLGLPVEAPAERPPATRPAEPAKIRHEVALLRDISTSLHWISGMLLFFVVLTILAMCAGLVWLGRQ